MILNLWQFMNKPTQVQAHLKFARASQLSKANHEHIKEKY